ncbi:hypothetical protein D3C86_2254200 [compost metagenome]
MTSLTKASVVCSDSVAQGPKSTFAAFSVSRRISPNMSSERPVKKPVWMPRRPRAIAVLKIAPPA